MARGTAVAEDGAFDALRDQAVSDLQALIDDATEARKNLRAYQTALEKNHRHLARGGRMSETPLMFDIRSVRAALTDRLDRLERARNAARLSIWRLQVAESTSIAEIARVWGFSRQLVSRALAGEHTRRTTSDG